MFFGSLGWGVGRGVFDRVGSTDGTTFGIDVRSETCYSGGLFYGLDYGKPVGSFLYKPLV